MLLKLGNVREELSDIFNVIFEISSHSDPLKYEIHKEKGALLVDRFMLTSNALANMVVFHKHSMRMDTQLIA